MDSQPNPADSPRKYVCHEVGVQSGADVYPPELLAAARANAIAGEFDEVRVRHEVGVQSGADVYPPELLAAARANAALES